MSNPAHQSHDDTCNISWRGDGEYFAVSAINPSTGNKVKFLIIIIIVKNNFMYFLIHYTCIVFSIIRHKVHACIMAMPTDFGGHGLSVLEILLLLKMAKFPFRTMDYSPWLSKNLID